LTGAVAAAVTVTDTSEDSVALAWTEVAGAKAYRITRSQGQKKAFALVGTTDGRSFADSALAPATIYRYRVTAVAGGEEGPVSAVVTAATRAIPPRCDRPGTCALAEATPRVHE
jgi:hypothetical protein